jgi:UDP-glucose 4-epimerase
MKILIIGKNSFIGRNFKAYSTFSKIDMISVRTTIPEDINYSKYEVILFLAAIVHQKKEISLDKYFEINTDLPFKIAQLAKKNGIKHFIFMSTISVYGKYTKKINFFNEFSTCKPTNNYGISKLKAESLLNSLNDENFIVTNLRIPLVYGESVKANMLSLINIVYKFRFLPFSNVENKRSYIAIENLVEYIDSIILKKPDGVILACDPPLSTTELVIQIAKNLNKKLILLHLPECIIQFGKK